jgi:hypothetical protein
VRNTDVRCGPALPVGAKIELTKSAYWWTGRIEAAGIVAEATGPNLCGLAAEVSSRWHAQRETTERGGGASRTFTVPISKEPA